MNRNLMAWPLARRGLLAHVHRPVDAASLRAVLSPLAAVAGATGEQRPLSSERF